ncbi:hypothetical protein IAD21_00777 [Abditibacteriota bacterium]|nr:hypothetical protein IAD21_00777 [Abditibacteriota bacterium]
MKHSARFPFLFACGVLATSCAAQNGRPAVTEPLRLGTLVQSDFENGIGWPKSPTSSVGTIDMAGSIQPSLGLKSGAMIASGPLPVQNTETNLGKLTFAFSLSANAARPVVVRVESFGKNKKRTGGLETTIYPAAPDFYQRYALDLSNFKPSGAGRFVPDAPYVGFAFSVGGSAWKGTGKPEIRLDNVHYAKPAWYVSAQGSNKNNGRSETTALATPQAALDLAGPGDIIVVMNGTYTANSDQGGIASFEHPGTPAGWITLKNYPGQQPLFSAVATWNAIKIGTYSKDKPYEGPALAYLEVRGLHVRGDSDVAKEKYATLVGQADPRTNGNGISVEGRSCVNKPHHLRFADNVVEYCNGGGISVIDGDWATIENNVSRNNCWWMIYAGSGISFLEGSNFDGTNNVYRRLVRNNIVSGNRCFVPWHQFNKISDGNGIIVDTSNAGNGKTYTGRTLIQSNLSFNNGGSGIHSFKSSHIDIINNTAYMNGASPELRWGQIFLQATDDATVINNILWARDGQPVNTVSLNFNDKQNTHILRANNLYFGGVGPIMGENDLVGDPRFVNPSIDGKVADFHLKPGSPAAGAGRLMPFLPFLDLGGKPRILTPAQGAYGN